VCVRVPIFKYNTLLPLSLLLLFLMFPFLPLLLYLSISFLGSAFLVPFGCLYPTLSYPPRSLPLFIFPFSCLSLGLFVTLSLFSLSLLSICLSLPSFISLFLHFRSASLSSHFKFIIILHFNLFLVFLCFLLTLLRYTVM